MSASLLNFNEFLQRVSSSTLIVSLSRTIFQGRHKKSRREKRTKIYLKRILRQQVIRLRHASLTALNRMRESLHSSFLQRFCRPNSGNRRCSSQFLLFLEKFVKLFGDVQRSEARRQPRFVRLSLGIGVDCQESLIFSFRSFVNSSSEFDSSRKRSSSSVAEFLFSLDRSNLCRFQFELTRPTDNNG